ncbi:MAG TPA: hypothetical protein VK048_06895 [Atopostipes sp.]|nr:hypothetical protein [Atopostipes sp.]
MVNFQFLSGLNTIGANIIDIQTETGRVIFDLGEVFDSKTGVLPDWSQRTENVAIFISHLHIDHMGSFRHVPAHIPIYMSTDSYLLYQLLLDIDEEEPVAAPIYPLEYNQEKVVGDITVAFKKSDHDVKGASAIFVQTPDVKFINSGDFRLTGNYPENVWKWVEEAKAFQPDIFLLEGTAFSFDEEEVEEESEDLSEQEMYDKWEELLEDHSNAIIFINTYIRDTERLLRLSKRTNSTNRKLVLEPKFAYLLEKYELYTDFYVLKELDTEKRFKEHWVSIEALQEEPEKYALQNSFNNRFLMQKFENGIYVHTNGEPLGDYDPRYMELMTAIEENNFSFEDYNVSGHATKEALVEVAKEVHAKTTVPWHSFEPEKLLKALAEAGLSTFLPERNVVYSIAQANKK